MNRTTAHAVVLGLLVPLFVGCSDEQDPNSPALPVAPEQVVVDLTGGHFSFLSPLGSGTKEGIFNPRLAPIVEVCRLATSGQPTEATPCSDVVAWFGLTTGSGPDRVTVDARREMYGVVWNLRRYSLSTGYYRVFVRTSLSSAGGGTTFGFADLAIASSNRAARELAGPGVTPATATSDLPIKFRIEEGALCGSSSDCFEGAVGPDGGVFVTNTEFAGIDFPQGALGETRMLVIERVTGADVAYCLPTRDPQYEGCYRYRLEPALAPGETFELEATVGVCLDPAFAPFEEELVLQKWDEVDPASLETLPRREVEFLECADFSLASIDAAGTFATLASAGGRFIGSIVQAFLPQPLAAATKSPYGGGLNDFSRIGWVRPLSIRVASGDAQSACVATTLPLEPTVLVTSTITGEPAAGVVLDFVREHKGGSVAPSRTFTDPSGLASTTWTLGPLAGEQTIVANGTLLPAGFPNYTLLALKWGRVRMQATAQSCTP